MFASTRRVLNQLKISLAEPFHSPAATIRVFGLFIASKDICRQSLNIKSTKALKKASNEGQWM